MKAMHSELFRELIYAYHNDTFEERVSELLKDPNIHKEALAKTISHLCGVDIDYTDNFSEALKSAIITYEANNRVVNKIQDCPTDCPDPSGRTHCQESCPFDAIIWDSEKSTTVIDNDACTGCGFCVEACPSGSLLDRTEFIPLLELFKNKEPVIAAVAPAIAGQFGDATLDQLRTSFKKLGFIDMFEVAFFADMLTLLEAVEFDHLVHDKDDLMITSCCCPMWVGMIKQIYGDLAKHVSPSVSPMIAAGRVLKRLNPKVKVVFIGPCIAKKAEVKQPDLIGDIDFVLTFAEVQEIFDTFEITPSELDPTPTTEYAAREGRLYARTGGVSLSVYEAVNRIFPEKSELFNAVQANGVVECKNILAKVKNGELKSNFLEGMGCVGGCVGGPKAILPKEEGRIKVDETAEAAKVKIALDNETMKSILAKIGINSVDDFKDHEKAKIFQREF
ncbi:[Fe-Fe] hydrogenase large subunit C-terminal domain-containing protein [Clostridium cellulovorans]|uniref:Hydrogenase large subunit domain protein n=1 Tax=Clostridium cellulovorans (strain ATCC 35296 / DSM 3052 / OCM 3 / 743B) TaxID=573061 RepID=D9SKR1_CLOC7|nr:[Fe-Fe] hydrogenase large subunit C-terminal domain-containing protein [Clostridium cellulovorans]ADL53483.1 hydrogenase large subunit domain protein [Clostridium cellulovorans 743B]